MRHKLEDLALMAGERILYYYQKMSSQEFSVQEKSDGSPVTSADLDAHRILSAGLKEISGLPVVSEEDFDPQLNRSSLGHYWLIDPLDGTKEFLNKSDMFTVNIALVNQDRILGGIVYAPASDTLYSAWEGCAYKNRHPLKRHHRLDDRPRKAAVSSLHEGSEVDQFLSENQIEIKMKVGSSLKFCQVAEGTVDLYPRLSPTSEWDTAAGQAIAEASGCRVLDLQTLRRLPYSKKQIENPSFIVFRPSPSLHLKWKGRPITS